PPGTVPPGGETKIMHASLKIGDTVVMASDGGCSGNATFGGFSLTISVKSAAEADRIFNALADGGQVRLPLRKPFLSPPFGVLAGRLGVGWMVVVEHEHQP